MADIDRQFAAYVRDREEHHLRVAVLLTDDWHAAEDLVQASLVKLCRGAAGQDGDPSRVGGPSKAPVKYNSPFAYIIQKQIREKL